MWLNSDFLKKRGIYSICSSNETVLDASIEFANEKKDFILIEATCHQVNQFGGYTNMTPEIFKEKLFKKVEKIGLPAENIILGGDHLGPDPWKKEYKDTALNKAKILVNEFVKSGFTKIHLDCSMPLGGDGDLSTSTIAEREAELCAVAEESHSRYGRNLRDEPVYVVGTEVPVAGGSLKEIPEVTSIEELDKTIEELENAFLKFGLKDAWNRVIAIVIRLGIGFGKDVNEYESDKTKALCEHLIKNYPSLYFEAHSTDYQTATSLKQMVRDGIRILKVGPSLTYAYRKAIFSLGLIEKELNKEKSSNFIDVIIELMNEYPQYWKNYYDESNNELRLCQMYSYFDRIRYYWSFEKAEKAIKKLFENLQSIPKNLLYQYLPLQYEQVREGKLKNEPEALIRYEIKRVLNDYYDSVHI